MLSEDCALSALPPPGLDGNGPADFKRILSFLGAALPLAYCSAPFGVPIDCAGSAPHYYNRALFRQRGPRARRAPAMDTTERFFGALFADAARWREFMAELLRRRTVRRFAAALNQNTCLLAHCHIYAHIARFGKNHYRLLVFFDSGPAAPAAVERRLKRAPRPAALEQIRGESPAVKTVLEAVERISRLDTAVFLDGETGTGKELVARAIHALSPRHSLPFVAVNCGALSETLLDSELFGHTRGAFTGAETETTGLFEAADGGTIFLDEIGEMSPAIQVKLLRVLQDGEVRKLGSAKSRRVNARVITATNRDLRLLAERNLFRQDLYYRIHVFAINLPPLRERGDDVRILAESFLETFSRAQRRDIRGFAPEAMEALRAHHWPGNIRELKNVIERACIVCDTPYLLARHLPLTRGASPPPAAPAAPIDATMDGGHLSKAGIIACLEKNRWKKAVTAKELRVSRATLWRKMKEFAIVP